MTGLVKRELSSSPESDALGTPNSSDTSSSPSTPTKKQKRSPPKKGSKEAGEKKSKTAWTAEEDAILLDMMQTVLKGALWQLIKEDGRLVHRTSYGCQYHAMMLLKQGIGARGGK